jgi:cytochrome c oxidase subunit 3
MTTEDAVLPLPSDQFVTAEQQLEAATLGMWIFLATEVLFFGALLVVYTAYRIWCPHEFGVGSRHLDFWLGTTNTAILLTSSFFMAGAVSAGRLRDRRSTIVLLVLTALLGAAFLAIKGYEWHTAIDDGYWPGTDKTASGGTGGVHLFYSLYFGLTGLHGIHMLVGLGLVGTTIWRLRARQPFAPNQNWLTLIGLYWHFIDIVWIFLYPLLYFVGRAS